jgi:ABC-2 type transport system ATP-binding protein
MTPSPGATAAAGLRTADDALRSGAVALESLHKRFGETVAVDGIDLLIADGEFF